MDKDSLNMAVKMLSHVNSRYHLTAGDLYILFHILHEYSIGDEYSPIQKWITYLGKNGK